MLTQAIREYAETPDRFAPVPRGIVDHAPRRRQDLLIQGADWGSVSAPHVAADEVEALVDEVRGLARQRNYVWWIGPSAQPSDLSSVCGLLGFVDPTDQVGTLRAVALTDEPASRRATSKCSG